MKLFIASLILATVSLAETTCNPVILYRKSATVLTKPVVAGPVGPFANAVFEVDLSNPTAGYLDRFDTTNVNEADGSHLLDRQIATICSNQLPETIPLYRGFNNGLHMTTTNPAEEAFKGYTVEKTLGYVYTQPPSGQTGFFQVYRVILRGTEYMTSERKDEGGGVASELFYSMPLSCSNQKAINANSVNSKCYNGSLKPTTTSQRPTSTRPPSFQKPASTATSVCNPFQANFTACSFTTSNCPTGRCLAPRPPDGNKSGVGAISTTMKYTEGFIKGTVKEAFSAIKSGWDLVTTVVKDPKLVLRFWMATQDPLDRIMNLGALVVKNCQVQGVGKASLQKLKSCITNQTQLIANDVQQKSKDAYRYCFQSDSETLGECVGRASFEVVLLFSGTEEIRAAEGVEEELRITLMTNDLDQSEITGSKLMQDNLKCPLLRRRGEGLSSSCLSSQNQVVDRVVVKAKPIISDAAIIGDQIKNYPILKSVIKSGDEVLALIKERMNYMTNSYIRDVNKLYLESKTIASEFETSIIAAKEGRMLAFGDALAPKISDATKNMEAEMRNILKIYKISNEEINQHRWISSSDSRINAYMQLMNDNTELVEQRAITQAQRAEFYYNFQHLEDSFKSDYSISDETAELYSNYASTSENAIGQEAMFTAGLQNIPNYDGYMIRYTDLEPSTMSALESSFSNQATIDLSTIVEGGYTDYILAGAPGGEPSTFDYYEYVLIIKSKTGRYISPVASDSEPEVVIVGSTKKFKVKNMLQAKVDEKLKNIYFLEEQ